MDSSASPRQCKVTGKLDSDHAHKSLMIVVVLAILQLPNASGSPIFKRIGVPSKIVSRVSGQSTKRVALTTVPLTLSYIRKEKLALLRAATEALELMGGFVRSTDLFGSVPVALTSMPNPVRRRPSGPHLSEGRFREPIPQEILWAQKFLAKLGERILDLRRFNGRHGSRDEAVLLQIL
jgi:hypothetical protein